MALSPSHLFFILLILFLYPQVLHSLSFQINNFDSNLNMVYDGDAKPVNGSIRFNGQLGWATYAQKLLLCDHTNNNNGHHLSDFKTHFSFLITNNNQNSNSTIIHSHGFTFFLAPSEFSPPLNSSGSFLGLFNSSTQSHQQQPLQTQIVHVEFDTFPNPEWDPPFQHIGMNKNSISSSTYSPWNSSTDPDQKTTHVRISYNSSAKNLSVTLNNNNNDNNAIALSHQVDLMEILPEKVSIGFSAASVEGLSIELWEFSSSHLDANSEEIMMIKDEKAINMNLLAVLIAWVGVFVVAIISIFLISLIRSVRDDQKKKDDEQQHGHGVVIKLASIYSDLNNKEASPAGRRFSYTYLAMATDNFSLERKLGQGGFGAVFEGHLPGAKKTVAVKKIFKASTQGRESI